MSIEDPRIRPTTFDNEVKSLLAQLTMYAHQYRIDALRVQYLHEDGTMESFNNARTAASEQKLLQRLGGLGSSVVGYESLQSVLDRAYMQAASGKGAQRHATGKAFHEQPMQTIQDLVGSGFATGQAMKKLQEAARMEPESAVRELLGAINYIAGAIIYIERQQQQA